MVRWWPGLALLLAAVACGCAAAPRARNGHRVTRVVAAEIMWGSIAAQIGGDRVDVTSLISDPEQDPHLFQSTARDAAAVSRADLVITNGLGYDDFADKLIKTGSSSHDRTVISVAHIVGARSDANPHLWYELRRVDDVATAVAEALTAKDPAGKDTFERNVKAFGVSMRPVLSTLDTLRAKYAHSPVAYTERVSEYLLRDAGLSVVSPPGFSRAIEDGNEPSAADTHAMNDLFAARRVRVLCYNPQATSATTDAVKTRAKDSNVPVVEMTETLPKNEPDYQTWMLHQTQALLAALGQ